MVVARRARPRCCTLVWGSSSASSAGPWRGAGKVLAGLPPRKQLFYQHTSDCLPTALWQQPCFRNCVVSYASLCDEHARPCLLPLLQPPAGSVPTFESAVAAVEKVRFFAGDVLSRSKLHVTVGHATGRWLQPDVMILVMSAERCCQGGGFVEGDDFATGKGLHAAAAHPVSVRGSSGVVLPGRCRHHNCWPTFLSHECTAFFHAYPHALPHRHSFMSLFARQLQCWRM